MCIAILNKSGRLLDSELTQASRTNPDGAGMMYANSDGNLVIMRSLTNQDVIDNYKKFREKDMVTPVVLHFRIATDGGITIDNCHPYTVNDEVSVVHNGILQNYTGMKTNMSDTRLFIADILSQIPTDELFTDYMNILIGQAIGYNKLIFLRKGGQYMICNEEYGHWNKEKTNWFSNSSYKPIQPTVKYVNYTTKKKRSKVSKVSGKNAKKAVKSGNNGTTKATTTPSYTYTPSIQKHGKAAAVQTLQYCSLCGVRLGKNEQQRGYCRWCYEWGMY